MRSPEVTRERILRQSGKLFNTQGYKATSLSDITEASGLTKGAIYQHFENKEKLDGEIQRREHDAEEIAKQAADPTLRRKLLDFKKRS